MIETLILSALALSAGVIIGIFIERKRPYSIKWNGWEICAWKGFITDQFYVDAVKNDKHVLLTLSSDGIDFDYYKDGVDDK